eukprot:194893_1
MAEADGNDFEFNQHSDSNDWGDPDEMDSCNLPSSHDKQHSSQSQQNKPWICGNCSFTNNRHLAITKNNYKCSNCKSLLTFGNDNNQNHTNDVLRSAHANTRNNKNDATHKQKKSVSRLVLPDNTLHQLLPINTDETKQTQQPQLQQHQQQSPDEAKEKAEFLEQMAHDWMQNRHESFFARTKFVRAKPIDESILGDYYFLKYVPDDIDKIFSLIADMRTDNGLTFVDDLLVYLKENANQRCVIQFQKFMELEEYDTESFCYDIFDENTDLELKCNLYMNNNQIKQPIKLFLYQEFVDTFISGADQNFIALWRSLSDEDSLTFWGVKKQFHATIFAVGEYYKHSAHLHAPYYKFLRHYAHGDTYKEQKAVDLYIRNNCNGQLSEKNRELLIDRYCFEKLKNVLQNDIHDLISTFHDWRNIYTRSGRYIEQYPMRTAIYNHGVLAVAEYVYEFYLKNAQIIDGTFNIFHFYLNELWNKLYADEQCAVLTTYVIFSCVNALREIHYYMLDNIDLNETEASRWRELVLFNNSNHSLWHYKNNHIPVCWQNPLVNLMYKITNMNRIEIWEWLKKKYSVQRGESHAWCTKFFWIIGNLLVHEDLNESSSRGMVPNEKNIFKAMHDILQIERLSFLPKVIDNNIIHLRCLVDNEFDEHSKWISTRLNILNKDLGPFYLILRHLYASEGAFNEILLKGLLKLMNRRIQ